MDIRSLLLLPEETHSNRVLEPQVTCLYGKHSTLFSLFSMFTHTHTCALVLLAFSPSGRDARLCKTYEKKDEHNIHLHIGAIKTMQYHEMIMSSTITCMWVPSEPMQYSWTNHELNIHM